MDQPQETETFSPNASDASLLAEYVKAFEKFGDLDSNEVNDPLGVGEPSTTYYDHFKSETPTNLIGVGGPTGSYYDTWRPSQIATSKLALETLYARLGLPGIGSTRLPVLYEALILSYRWNEVHLGQYTLLANHPASDLTPLLETLKRDRGLFDTLTPNGYFRFAKGADRNYDPVCFDFRHRQKNGDCRVVQLDHEEILCNGRIVEVEELASSFRNLVQKTIDASNSKS